MYFFTAKPIDLLARYINAEDDEDSAAIELHEPYTYLNVRIYSLKFPLFVDYGIFTTADLKL